MLDESIDLSYYLLMNFLIKWRINIINLLVW